MSKEQGGYVFRAYDGTYWIDIMEMSGNEWFTDDINKAYIAYGTAMHQITGKSIRGKNGCWCSYLGQLHAVKSNNMDAMAFSLDELEEAKKLIAKYQR